MEYSSGIISNSFWFYESKKTAMYILDGCNKDEISKIAIEENIYQVDTNKRSNTICSKLFNRLSIFSDEILKTFLSTDLDSAKFFVLVSIMTSDKLFFEFMNEVIKDQNILGNFTVDKKDAILFLRDKQLQSQTVADWKESTINRLATIYINLLYEAGIFDKKSKKITIPLIDQDFICLLKKEGYTPFINTIIVPW